MSGDKKVVRSEDQIASSDIDLCKLKLLPIDSIRFNVLRDAKKIIASISKSKSNEECIFEIIDQLAKADNLNDKSFKALEKLSNSSDGFLSEYLDGAAAKLFEEEFTIFFQYLYRNQESPLLRNLVGGLGIDLLTRKESKESLRVKLSAKIKNGKQRLFLDKIFEKIDPSKFE